MPILHTVMHSPFTLFSDPVLGLSVCVNYLKYTNT